MFPTSDLFGRTKVKQFYSDSHGTFIPKDIVDCVLRKNPGLVENGEGRFGLHA